MHIARSGEDAQPLEYNDIKIGRFEMTEILNFKFSVASILAFLRVKVINIFYMSFAFYMS